VSDEGVSLMSVDGSAAVQGHRGDRAAGRRPVRLRHRRAAAHPRRRIAAAWKTADADAFADAFGDDGSFLPQDTQPTSREQIRGHMRTGFTNYYSGGPD
jgi:hypothetical protein